MGLWAKLSGKEVKGGNAFCFRFGPDKHFCRRNLESQGSHVQDNRDRLAFFASPNSSGVLSKMINGAERTLGPVIMAFDPITELYSFPLLDFPEDRNKQVRSGGNGHDAFESDEILDNSWAEGFSLAAQKQEDTEVRNRLLQILLLAVLGTVAMFLLVASSTGLLKDLISGAGKFFGGG